MGHRKPFEPLPDFARDHPQADRYRINRLETVLGEHLEECRPSRNAIADQLASLAILAVEILSALSLVSPSVREAVLKAFGH